MIKVAKAHEKTCQEYQIHKQAHSMAPRVTTPILCYKQVLCQSLFRKALLRGPVANADAHTIMVNALPMGLHAAAVARRTTGLSNVEILGGGSVHLVAHPPWEGHRSRDNEDSMASSSTKAGDEEEEEGTSTPNKPGAGWGCGGKPHKIAALTVTEFLPGPAHPPKVTGLGNEVVSMNADLLRPAHPPRTTGEQFINTFACDALTGNGNEEYSLPSSNLGQGLH